MSRQTVSAVIMSKNSADIIEGTLKSVQGWADEIVVIDGFSADNTVEICKKYTDKIYQNKWDGIRFCTERNLGTSKATSDWCLHIDPDERATPELKKAISDILSRPTEFSAFKFRKKNYFMGHFMRYGGWYHYSLHFFRRGKAAYDGIIHERLIVDGLIGTIEAPLEHYPFNDFSTFVNRHNGYSSREALSTYETEGVIKEDVVEYNLKTKPLHLAKKFYLNKMGYLDGIYGFFFTVLFAWVHFLNWAKYWELCQSKR